jgi:hypothetical protein
MGARPEPTPSNSSPRWPLGIAILAIALYIAVIDAAVETFLSSAHEAGMTDRATMTESAIDSCTARSPEPDLTQRRLRKGRR